MEKASTALAKRIKADAENGGPLRQAVAWDAASWRGHADTGTIRNEIDLVAQHTKTQDGRQVLDREAVFIVAGEGALPLFVGAMAWGFGPTGYGAYRTARIVSIAGRPRVEDAVQKLTDASAESPDAAWAALNGDAKLKYLGPAFATKVAYFSQPRDTVHSPLIADVNTSWGFWSETCIAGSASTRTGYLAYVDACYQWADELGCRADAVELALFTLGKERRVKAS